MTILLQILKDHKAAALLSILIVLLLAYTVILKLDNAEKALNISNLNVKVVDLSSEVDHLKAASLIKDKLIKEDSLRVIEIQKISASSMEDMKSTIKLQTKLCKISGKKEDIEAALNSLQDAFEEESKCIVYPSLCASP